MNEMTKSHPCRLRHGDYAFIRGQVLDIGCGPDPIRLAPPSVVTGFDLEQGDAHLLAGVADESHDCIVSSHCLEHLADPETALRNCPGHQSMGSRRWRMALRSPSITHHCTVEIFGESESGKRISPLMPSSWTTL